MNAQEREILKTLIQIVWADGQVDDRERDILGKMLVELDLTPKDIAEVGHMMTEAPEAPKLAEVLSKSPAERRDVMKIAMAMAMDNGHLNPPEMRYVQAIASKLEIDKDEVEKIRLEVKALTTSSE